MWRGSDVQAEIIAFLGGWVGGWVGRWVVEEVEEDEAVGMRCWRLRHPAYRWRLVS